MSESDTKFVLVDRTDVYEISATEYKSMDSILEYLNKVSYINLEDIIVYEVSGIRKFQKRPAIVELVKNEIVEAPNE
jgi:hypothetical protein